MSNRDLILREMEFFRGNGEGIEAWFSENISEVAANVLANCEKQPISLEVLNQILVLSHEGGMSEGFFWFYFLSDPHSRKVYWYDPKKLAEFDQAYLRSTKLQTLNHLKWGLKRLYIDALLYFGNIRQCYRTLRDLDRNQLDSFFEKRIFNTQAITGRSDYLPLSTIAKDDRYLIAETACKTYAPADETMPDLLEYIKGRLRVAAAAGRSRVKIKDLVAGDSVSSRYDADQLSFSLDEAMEQEVGSALDLENAIEPIIQKFKAARTRALSNTKLYLSMVGDMDVYVATSMRSRADFRSMADFCETTFSDPRVRELKQSLDTSFYHPGVLATIAPYNTAFGKKFDALFHQSAAEIKNFAEVVEEQGGSILGNVDGVDVTVEHVAAIQESDLLRIDYGAALDKFRRISKLKKTLDQRPPSEWTKHANGVRTWKLPTEEA